MNLTKDEQDYAYILGLKKQYNVNHLGEIFGIENELDLQCPKVDEIVKSLNRIEKEISISRYDDEDSYKDKLEYAQREIDGLEDKVEELRTAIETLRAWGHEWKKLAREMLLITRDTHTIDEFL